MFLIGDSFERTRERERERTSRESIHRDTTSNRTSWMRAEPRLQPCRDTDIVECRSTTASKLLTSSHRCSSSSWLLEESMECMLHCLEGSCRTNSADPSTSVNNNHNNPAWHVCEFCELCELRALIARVREPVSLRDARDVQSCCSSDRSSRSTPGAARGMLEAGSGVDCCSRSTTQEGDPTVTEESFLGELCRSRSQVPIQSNPIQSIICQSWCLCVEEIDGESKRRGEEERRASYSCRGAGWS